MTALDAYRWGWPWGWAAQTVWPNIVASVIWAGPPFLLGALWGQRRARRADAHNTWVTAHLARIHHTVTGRPADPHPHYQTGANP
jgi:hypothetical protein